MYHVTDSPRPKSPKKKWFTFAKTGKKYASAINMATILMEDTNSIVTKKNKSFKEYAVLPVLDPQAKGNVKLIINPLSVKEIYPIGLEGSYARKTSHSSLESLSSNDNTISNDDSIDRKIYGKSESLPGMSSMVNWQKNHWFVQSIQSITHCFRTCFSSKEKVNL